MLGKGHLSKVSPRKELGAEVGGRGGLGACRGRSVWERLGEKETFGASGERQLERRPQVKLIMRRGEGGSLKE